MQTGLDYASNGAHPQALPAGQGGFGPNKWHLLGAVEAAREPLGIKGTTIAVLRAMLSYLRHNTIDAAQDDQHICFASNAALARRAHVSVQTVERHVAKLVSLGLISRKSSGNGKRWARRNRQGQIILATGLSVMPLVTRHPEFLGLAQADEARRDALAALRDRCAHALAALKDALGPGEVIDALTKRARTLFRRKPDRAALETLLADISAEMAPDGAGEPVSLRGTDLSSEGHKEANMRQESQKTTSSAIKVSPAQMERAFPKLCHELRFERSQRACDRRLDEVATELDLGPVWGLITDLGPALRFMLLGYLLERLETIKNPRAYAMCLVTKLRNGEENWQKLLSRPKHRNGRLSASDEIPATTSIA